MSLPAIAGGGGPSLMLDLRAGYPAGRTFTRGGTGTYFDAAGTRQTAAVNEPRIDYHPSTHARLGLLLERQVANRLLNSDAPATQTTASLPAGTYCLWVEGSGSATSSAGTATGTGFGVAVAGSPNVFVITVAGTVTITVTGSLTRFQCEQNASAPSSYIQTAGSTVSRQLDADAQSVVPWLNKSSGTFVIEATPEQTTPPTNNGVFMVDDGTDNNRAGLRITGGGSQLVLVALVGGSAVITQNLGAVASGTRFRAGFTYDPSGFTSSMNGSSGPSGGATMSPALWTTHRLGQILVTAQQFNGWVSRHWYFPRAMAQPELNYWTK